MKRRLALFLALIMVLGILPVNVFAATDAAKPAPKNDKNYEEVTIDGRPYKVYKLADLMDKPSKERSLTFERMAKSTNLSKAQSTPAQPYDGWKFYLDLVWETIDRPINNATMPVYFGNPTDPRAIKLGHFNVTTGANEDQYIEMVQEYFGTQPSIDLLVEKGYQNITIATPNDMLYDFILASTKWDKKNKVGTAGVDHRVVFRIEGRQNVMHGYGIRWFDTDASNRDKIVARWEGKENQISDVKLGTENRDYSVYKNNVLDTNDSTNVKTYPDGMQYSNYDYYYNGKKVTTYADADNLGKYDDEVLAISELRQAPTASLKVKDGADYKLKGEKVLKNNTKYLYNSVGDYRTFHLLSMREALEVKFNTGKGSLTDGGDPMQDIGTAQEIGHSEKIKGNESGREITFPDGSKLIPLAKPEDQTTDNEFKGWNTDENATAPLEQDELDALTFTEKTTTFYAIYGPKDDYHINVEYLDENEAPIDAKYKIDGQKYPAKQSGEKDQAISAEHLKAPEFLGYELKQTKTDPVLQPGNEATYTKDGTYTVKFIYKKLDSIIPEDKASEDVKKTYIPVTWKIDENKGEFKKDGAAAADASITYYVNPVENKTFTDVVNEAGLVAASKDENKYKLNTENPNTFVPAKVKSKKEDQEPTLSVEDGTEITNWRFTVDKGLVATVNFEETKAEQFKDKLKPVDIKVWEKDPIDWKKGVELKEANQALQDILDENTTVVTDENGRNSDAANLPNGEEGNLKVTFSDGSSVIVKDQMLYVAGEKNDNNENLPKDAVKVEFKIGEGVTGTEKTMYVKPGTDVKSDAPTVSLKEGYKDYKWYKGNEVAKDADFKVSSNVIFTANAGQTDAQKYGDKLEVQDIVKWVDDQVEWKDGVKPIEGVTFKNVEDLSNRNTTKAGVFPGKLKVTFGDDSTKEIDGQRLIVRDKKGDKVTANEDDPGTYPKDAVNVKFIAGAGIEKLDPANKEMVLKSGEALEAKDYPEVTVKDNFKEKDNKTDYYDVEPGVITENKTITASTTQLGKGTAVVKFVDADGNALDPKADEKLQLAGQSYDQSFSGQEGVAITYDKSKAPKILGYEFTNEDPVISPANFEEDKEATITLKYKKLDDVIPGEGNTKPEGYVTVKFTAQKGAKLTGETIYYVNPKAGKTLADTKAPSVESTDAKKYEVKTGKDLWKPVLNEEQKITKDETFEAQVIELGKPVVNYPDVDLEKGGSKDVTPEIKDNKGNPQKPTKTPEILDENNQPVKPGEDGKITVGDPDKGIKITPKEDGTITVEVPKNYDGPNTVEVPVQVTIPGEDEPIKTTLKIKVVENKPEEPKPVEPKKNDNYINLVPVGETEAPRVTDVHAIYLYGYPGNTVQPQGNMTRAEAAAMVARLKNLDMSDTSKPDFKDVESKWYNSAINAVVKAGLMKGYPDGTFAPNGKITRAEFAQLIKGIDLANSAELPFTDVAGHWGIGAISQAYANKRIAGYPDNTFRPNNDITRAEAVTILNNLFDRKVDETGLAGVRDDIVEFKDLSRSHWAYYEIVEASNTHEFYRQKDGEVTEAWVRVLKTWNDFLN